MNLLQDIEVKHLKTCTLQLMELTAVNTTSGGKNVNLFADILNNIESLVYIQPVPALISKCPFLS